MSPEFSASPSSPILSKYADWFNLLARIRSMCAREFGIDRRAISFDPRERRQFLAVLFGLRALDTLDAIVVLAKRGFVAQGEVLFRTLLELLFYFCCVAKSQEAAERFIALFQVERLKMGKKIARWDQPDLVQARGDLPIAEIQRAIEEEIQASGVVQKNIAEWASEAGLEQLYLSSYAYLSSSVHSSLSSLERYHLVIDEKKSPVAFHGGPGEKGLAPLLAALAEGGLMAVVCNSVVFDRPKPAEVDELNQEVKRLAERDRA